MVNIFDVAKLFLSYESMTHKKLQKLCYYFYSWDIALNGLENKKVDTYFQAWVHGPVSPSLYHYYKTFGWSDIPQETNKPIFGNSYIEELSEQIFRIYGHSTGDELELLTHEEKPWLEARGELAPYEPSDNILNEETIYNFYKSELNTDF